MRVLFFVFIFSYSIFSFGELKTMNLDTKQTFTTLANTLCEIEKQYQSQKTKAAPGVPSSPNLDSGPLSHIDDMIRLSVGSYSFPDKASEKIFYDNLKKKQNWFNKIYFEQLAKKKLLRKDVRSFFKKNDLSSLNMDKALKDISPSCILTKERIIRLFWEIKD